jgi:hypothetical protein
MATGTPTVAIATKISGPVFAVAGAVIGLAVVKDHMSLFQAFLAALALIFVKCVVSATGLVLFYWLQGNYLKMVEVMAQNPQDPRVQWLGAGAIGWGNGNESKLRSVAKSGGLDIIVAAMNSHRIYHGVQREGCKAIQSLALDPNVNSIIIDAGGVEAVMNAIKYGAKGSQGDKISLAAMGSC